MQASWFRTSFRTGAIMPLKDIDVDNAGLPTGGYAVAIFELPKEKKPLFRFMELSLDAGFVRCGSVNMLALGIHSTRRSLYCLLDASDEATWKMVQGWRRSGNAYFFFTSEASSEPIAIRIDEAFAAEQEARCRSLVSAQERLPGNGANSEFVEAAIRAAASGAMADAYAKVAGKRRLDVAAAFPHDCYAASCLRARLVLQRDKNMAAGLCAWRASPFSVHRLLQWADTQLIEAK